ncbi:PREDICTED: uncharacterized protein LOC104704943 [Camelina sativa]|uniref:Uncharacterized protein LOC104704943 n=1 Tax=Camelina sativa TaxID=90675 RepID=A0ABM0T139_CAMSA|nr:PREDICTED: uncharacterized protein LOC104704943 [Camelina sativa]
MALNTYYQDTATLVTSSISDNRNYNATESCFDAFSDKTVDVSERREEKKAVAPETHPPTIFSSNVPSVLKREYTSDGRLLLKEEKMRGRHEYLRAHRSNGRLILQLVSLDDDDDDNRDSDVKDGDE